MASVADAEETLRSTNAKANFQRLTRLLMCGGLRLLRETFDSIHKPADLPLKLSDPAIQTQLRGARLTRPECACLYPSTGLYGKSSDFNITLIFRLLRTICNLTPPPGPRGWDDLPNSSDHSLEADLVRIKYYRNEVYGHKKTMEIPDLEFDDLWGKISEALIRIAASISGPKKDEWKKSIDDFFLDPLTPEEERYIEELNTWYKQDMDVKTEVEQLKEEFKTLARNIKEEVAKQSQRPAMNIGGPVAILVVNTIESITQAGLPIILSHPSGRSPMPRAGESLGICSVPVPEQEGAEGVSDSRELQLNPLEPPTEIQIWNVILSFKKSFELFLQYLGYKLNVFVRSHDVGSLLITVECSSLEILEGLWEDYRSGHISEITQEILVTSEVLEKLGLDEVKLKTFISEEEYEKGKQIFIENSALSEQRAAVISGSPVEAAQDTVSESVLGEFTTIIKKEKDSDGVFQMKPDSSAQVQLKTPSELKRLRNAEKRKRQKERKKLRSLGLSSTQGEPDTEMRQRTSSQQDYLQKISKLEKENNELRIRVEAIEKTLQGKKEKQPQRKESRKMVQLERRIIELEKRLQSVEEKPEKYRIREFHSKPVVRRSFADEHMPPAREYGFSTAGGPLWGTREQLSTGYFIGHTSNSRPPGSSTAEEQSPTVAQIVGTHSRRLPQSSTHTGSRRVQVVGTHINPERLEEESPDEDQENVTRSRIFERFLSDHRQ